MVRSKCRAIAELAVVEMAQVGVRTRAARALALAASSAKKRKVNSLRLKSTSTRADCVKLRSGRRRSATAAPGNSVTPPPAAVAEDRRSSRSSDQAAASCCSSNGSSERIKLADLEDDDDDDDESVEVETSMHHSCRERRSETAPTSKHEAESSDDLDSTAGPSEANSRLKSTAEKMPTGLEIEDFFAEAEKSLQKQFQEKYNYDIVKDEPLEGRYEWIRLKPLEKATTEKSYQDITVKMA